MNASENAMDGLLRLAEVAASMDPPVAAASAAPCTNAAQQLLKEPAVLAALIQCQHQLLRRQQQQQQCTISAHSQTGAQGNHVTTLLQQLQRLKDALSQSPAEQQQPQQQHISSMQLPRADAAIGSVSSRTGWQVDPQLLPYPGAHADPAFMAAGGMDDNSLAGFMPIQSARISNSAIRSQPSAAPWAGTKNALDDSAEDTYNAGLGSCKQYWTDEDHSKLVMLVDRYGLKNWSSIASHLPGRSGKECRERYVNHAAVQSQGNWTPQEELKLAHLHSQYGNNWALIACQMPGRSDMCLKNHWNALQRAKHPGQDHGGNFFWVYTQGVLQDMSPADALAAALATVSGAERLSLVQALAATASGAGGLSHEGSAGGSSTAGAAHVPHAAALLQEDVHPAALPVVQQPQQHLQPSAPAQVQSAAEALAAAAAMVVAAAATQAKSGSFSQPAAEALAAAAATVARAVAAPAVAPSNATTSLPSSPPRHAAAAAHSSATALSPGMGGPSLTPTARAQMLPAPALPQFKAGLEACWQQHQREQAQQQEQERLTAPHQAYVQRQEQERLTAAHQAYPQRQKTREQQALEEEEEVAAAAAAAARQAYVEHQQALAEQAAAAVAAHQSLEQQKQQHALAEVAAAAAACQALEQHQALAEQATQHVYAAQHQVLPDQCMQQVQQAWQGEQEQLQHSGSKCKAVTDQPSKHTEPQQLVEQTVHDVDHETMHSGAEATTAADKAEAAAPPMPGAFQKALCAAAVAATAGNAQAAAAALTTATTLARKVAAYPVGARRAGTNGHASAAERNRHTSLATSSSKHKAPSTGKGSEPNGNRACALPEAAANNLLAPLSVFAATPNNGKTGLSGLVLSLAASAQRQQPQLQHLQLRGAQRADAARLEAALQNFTTGLRSTASTKESGSALVQVMHPHPDQKRLAGGPNADRLQKQHQRMCNLVAGALSSVTAVPRVGKGHLAARRDRQRALEQFLALRVPLLPVDKIEEQETAAGLHQYGQMPAQPLLSMEQQQQLVPPVPKAPADAATAALNAGSAVPQDFDIGAAGPAGAGGAQQQHEASVVPTDTTPPAAAATGSDTGAAGAALVTAHASSTTASASDAAGAAAAQQVELMKLASTAERKKLLESLKALGLLRTDVPPGSQLAIQLVVPPSQAAAASLGPSAATKPCAEAAVANAVGGDAPAAPGSPDSNCSSKSSDPAAAVKLEQQEQPATAEPQHDTETKQAEAAVANGGLASSAAPTGERAASAPAVGGVNDDLSASILGMPGEHQAAAGNSEQAGITPAAGTMCPAAATNPQDQTCTHQTGQPSHAQPQQRKHAAAPEPEVPRTVGAKRPITAVLGSNALSVAISAAKKVLRNSPP